MATIKQNFTNPDKKSEYLKTKVKNLVLLLKKWKQYTDVLSMTSVETLKTMKDTSQ